MTFGVGVIAEREGVIAERKGKGSVGKKSSALGAGRKLDTIYFAGWSSPVAREAHNLEVVSSNLAPATSLFG